MLELFIVFFKAGILTVGGGLAIIPVLEPEIIGREWLTAAEMGDIVAVAMSMPGAFAVNVSTFVGYNVGGVLGGVVATAGLVTPALMVMVAIALCFKTFVKNRWVVAALNGVRPAVLGLIAAFAASLALLFLVNKNAGEISWWQVPNLATIALFAALFAFDWKFKPHPVALIGISMALGVLLFGVLGIPA